MFLYLVAKKFQYNNSTQINNNKKKLRFSVQALLIMSVRETRLFGRINKTLLFPHLQQVPVTFIWFSLTGRERESQFASCFFLYWEERGKESSWTTSHQLPWQPTIPNNPWKKIYVQPSHTQEHSVGHGLRAEANPVYSADTRSCTLKHTSKLHGNNLSTSLQKKPSSSSVGTSCVDVSHQRIQ